MKSFYFFFLIFLLPGQGFSSDSESDKKIQYKSYALFFAVNEYESLQNLNNPVRDAHKIAKILSENYDFETEVIENPDLNLMKTTLIRYRDGFINGDLDPKGQLLIYFSGHGKTEYETGFFLPKDTDPTDLYSTGFSYDYWRKFINRLNCQHVLVSIDACFSVRFDPKWKGMRNPSFSREGEREIGDQLIQQHTETRFRCLFTSDGKEDETPDKSDFAKQFQNGLLVGAGEDNILTSSELFKFIIKATPTPHCSNFGDDEAGSSFLFFGKERKYTEYEKDLKDWTKAKTTNTLIAYEGYLKNHPQGSFANPAKTEIRKLKGPESSESTILSRDKASYEAAKKANTEYSYRKYLDDWPKGVFRAQVKLILKRILIRKDSLAWHKVKADQSPNSAIKYLNLYPKGKHRFQAEYLVYTLDKGLLEGLRNPTIPIMKPLYLDSGQSPDSTNSFLRQLPKIAFAETEITNDQFCAFLNQNISKVDEIITWISLNNESGIKIQDGRYTSRSGFENYPVNHVSWYGATAYCEWLSEKLGEKYRLPTQGEWVIAANQHYSNASKFPIRMLPQNIRNYSNLKSTRNEDKFSFLAPVKSFKPNVLSIYDLRGNVWEWALDSPGSNKKRTKNICGGGWNNPIEFVLKNEIHSALPNSKRNDVGFRPVRVL